MDDNIDIIEDLIDKMESRYEMLDRGLSEAQRSLTYGDYALVITTSEFNTPFMVGRILTPEETQLIRHVDQSLIKNPSGDMGSVFGVAEAGTAPGTEAEEIERYARGFRYGLWQTSTSPNGFAAHIHLTRLFPITAEEFAEASELEYDIRPIHTLNWYNDATRRILESVEKLPQSPQRMKCARCGSAQTCISSYYRGHLVTYAAQQGSEIRLGQLDSDEIREVASRHVYCQDCGHEGPDLMADSSYTFTDVQRPGLTVLETVFGYGPDLPRPDWGQETS